MTEEMGIELRRWQDEIRDLVIRLSGAPPEAVDGLGCDSGDPLDVTLAEIGIGFVWVADHPGDGDE